MLRKRLREATRDAHDRLDATVTGHSLTTAIGYGHYLDSMLKLYQYFSETQAAVALEAGFESQTKSLVTAIMTDLNSIGYQVSTYTIDVARPAHPDEPISFRWGAAYTLEGSAMGAVGMLKSMKESEFSNQCRFLEFVTLNCKSRWPKFIEALEKNATNSEAAIAAQPLLLTWHINCSIEQRISDSPKMGFNAGRIVSFFCTGCVGLFPGTGMGLAICKRIVERNLSWVRLPSVVGKGRRFFVMLLLKS